MCDGCGKNRPTHRGVDGKSMLRAWCDACDPIDGSPPAPPAPHVCDDPTCALCHPSPHKSEPPAPRPTVRIRDPHPLPADFGLRLHGTVHQRLAPLGYADTDTRAALVARYRANVAEQTRKAWRAMDLVAFARAEKVDGKG